MKMGLTKQYLRNVPGPVFGLIASQKSNIVFLEIRGQSGKYCAVGACEDVIIWDLRTGEKFLTLKGEKHEVTKVAKSADKNHIAVGYNDGMIRVFDLNTGELAVNFSGHKSTITALQYDHQGLRLVSGSKDTFVKFWDLETQHCFKTLVGHRSEGNENSIEVFRLPTEDELKKHLTKRKKKLKRKLKDSGADEEDVQAELKLEDEIQRLKPIKMSSKVVSADIVMEKDNHTKKERKLRYLISTIQCIRNMSCDYSLCSIFAPGDRHVILGTKNGKLQIFDIASGSLLESIEAHSGAVWSLSMLPDKRGIVSGSADHDVKFWNFELITDPSFSTTSKRLTLEHVKTLKMDEDVLCVKYSPDQRLLAVALLDNTVKVFFADTLKFFLSLYGHKLPVLCMDISTDSSLLITGSADRNVKIWGLDFGDCHKSIFAHDDSIMCLQFVPKTHLFFTGSKDRKIKQWDADNFEHIITLEGHHAEVWCLAVSPNGSHIVTGSHDKSLRLWEKTKEPLILEEEREMAREKQDEEAVADSGEPVVPGETNTEVGLAGKKTIETVKGAERIMEAIELYKEETEKLKYYELECKKLKKQLPAPALHPMMIAYGVTTPSKYMLMMLKKIRSSELEESLLVLPFSYVIDLLKILEVFLDSGWEIELTCRCLFFLLRVHHGQITSNQVLLPVIDRLKEKTLHRVQELKDRIGFNLAGLQHLQREMEQSADVTFFMDASDRFKTKKKKEKKKAILSIKFCIKHIIYIFIQKTWLIAIICSENFWELPRS
ncbi:hypothetical protein KUTeg_006741 [Tegillarca granosa]|uniref:WD repeat domain 3 n=1 Tax=Tegillarca granosa TaxID=220873 RepID=A0ABQ9FEE6_TEGGR|nr:hypothetical protein KUTeg_006741 [Tegillarca granosa]